MTKSRPNLTGSVPINPRPPVSTKHSLITTLGSIRDPQNCCVLFISVPTEIRSIIFSLALYGYDDETRPYPDDAYYSRPGYRFRRRIDTALLATCRRIYGETHDLPISQNEHIFWCGSQWRGPSRKFRDQPAGYLRRLTGEQKPAVTQVHFFTQLIWLDYVFPKVCKLPNMRPKHIKITFRHTDWQYWDENAPLVMTSNWGDNLKFLHGLTTLEVELEALERDEAQVWITNLWRSVEANDFACLIGRKYCSRHATLELSPC